MVNLARHSVPTENVQHTEKDTALNVNGSDVGTGTLYITERVVVWLNQAADGLELEYRQITLHAVSRDLASFPHPHLLLHYEGKIQGISNGQSEEEEEDMSCQMEEEGGNLVEIRFVPQNMEALNGMFEAMSNCQVLHPDLDDDCVSEEEFEDAEEEGNDGFFTGEEGFNQLSEEGRANLERFNQMLHAGQGESDLSTRTSQITLSNGHHNPDEKDCAEDGGQFNDADGMND